MDKGRKDLYKLQKIKAAAYCRSQVRPKVSLQALTVTLANTPENGKERRPLFSMYQSHRLSVSEMRSYLVLL